MTTTWHVSATGGGAVRGRGTSAIRWIAWARIGALAPRPQGRRRSSILDAHEAFVAGLIEDQRDITLNEMVERLAAGPVACISRGALSAWLGRRRWTFKKSPPMHWSRSGPTS